MNYKAVLEAVADASLFDLHRLNVAIRREIENPARIAIARSQLRLGMNVTIFDGRTNDLQPARVIELRPNRALVETTADGKRWQVHYCMINIEGVDAAISPEPGTVGMRRSEVRVGQMVGFLDRQNRETFGRVARLNPRTASVVLNNGKRWLVDYGLLFPAIEGEHSSVEMAWSPASPNDDIVIEFEPE